MRQAFGAESVAGARPLRRNGQVLAYGSRECPDFADAVADHPEAEQIAGVVAGSRALSFFDERPRSVEQALTGGPGVEPCARDHRGDGVDVHAPRLDAAPQARNRRGARTAPGVDDGFGPPEVVVDDGIDESFR